ncbi:ClbS/DfsB family four-helix bundle protein [Yoonia sp. 208BN28-4]|uniref:ClbS/DfsB family four-helix bundle protein n=1 Tax=Yoonia sp. 208BN28-4 TaxID=3126505 RepID=UPI00309AF60F
MAATSQSDLLAITVKEYGKLRQVIDALDTKTAMRKRADDTTIKDVIAHRAHWIGLFLGWYADGLAGKTVHFPAEGYKWNDLKRYNAELRARQTELDWKAAKALLAKAYADLIAFIESHDTPALYGGPMKGARNTWTPGRWAEAAGPSHFRSATKYVRACLKDDRAA